MASGKTYKISFKLGADLESSFASIMGKAERDFKALEKQIKDIEGLRISGNVMSGLQTEVQKLEREMRQISRIPGPTGYFTDLKNDARTVLPDLRDIQRAMEAISRVRTPANQFDNGIERYIRQIKELEESMKRIRNNPGPSGGGGGGGDPSGGGGGGGFVALGGPALMAGAAVAAAGVGVFSVAEDYQKAMNQIQASTNVTAEQMDQMRDSAKAVYGANLGEGWEDIGNVMSTANQVTGLMGTELENATKGAISLRDTFENMDVESSIKTATTLSKQFGIEISEAQNLLAQGGKQGLDYSGELLDSANEYAVYFKTLGLSAEDMFNVFKSGKDSGAFNLDKVGDAVKEFGIRVKDGSKGTNEAMAELFAPDDIDDFIGALNMGGTKTKEFTELAEKMGGVDPAKDLVAALQKGGTGAEKAYTSILNQMSAGGDILDGVATGALKGTDAMSQIVEKLMSMDNKTDQARLGVALFGTQWEDMEADTIAALTNIGDSFDQTKDTIGEITKIKYSTIGQAFKGIGRQLQTTFILPLVDAALPALSAFSNWFAGAIPKVKSFFGALGGNKGFQQVSNFVKEAGLNIQWLFENGFDGEMEGVAINYAKMLGMDDQAAGELAIKAKNMFNGIKEGFAQFRAWIGPTLAQIGKVAWNLITSVASGFGRIISAMAPIVAYVVGKLGPIISQVFATIGNVVIPQLIAAWDAIAPKVGAVVGLVGPLMTAMFNAIKPTIDNIVAAFEFAWPYIEIIVSEAINIIKGVVGGLLDALGGIITFITGVFSGNWSQAWNGIVQTFGGIWGGLVSMVEGPINAVIRMVNRAIESINSFKVDMPDILGGGTIGFNVGKIPEIGGEKRSTGSSSWGKGNNSRMTGMQEFARGGYADRPSIFGEAGPEMAIPLNNKQRSHDLLAQTNRMMGYGSGGETHVTYAPNVVIQGNADEQVVNSALSNSYQQFKGFVAQLQREQGRVRLG